MLKLLLALLLIVTQADAATSNLRNLGGGSSFGTWTSFSPSGLWTTNVTYTGKYRQITDSNGDLWLDMSVRIAASGTPNTAACIVNLPSGYTIDTARLIGANAGVTQFESTLIIKDASAGNYLGSVGYNDTTSLSFRYWAVVGSNLTQSQIAQNAPQPWASGDYLEANVFMIPVTSP